MKTLTLTEEQLGNTLGVPEVIGGNRVNWYHRTIIDTWIKTGRYDECERAVRGNYKVRAIKKILSIPWIQGYVRMELKRRGYTKEVIEQRLIKDIEKIERMDEGQRDSLKILAKVKGLLNEGVTNVGIGMTFDVRQGNGSR
jgi:hypothetical protein